jgi:hypothetical protein
MKIRKSPNRRENEELLKEVGFVKNHILRKVEAFQRWSEIRIVFIDLLKTPDSAKMLFTP